MSSVRLSLTRLQVYVLLADSEFGGLSQSLAAKRLNLNRSTISEHVSFLESEQYIKAVTGCRCPILYGKGTKSAELDALVIERSVRDSVRTCVGYASSPECSDLSVRTSKQDLTRIENARVHANGSVTFNVEKVGDLHELLIKNGSLKKRVRFFAKEPSISEKNGRGASCWDTHLWFKGEKVRIQFWQGKERSTLRIWPPEQNLPPSLLPSDDELEKFMESRAQDIASFISKHGGWRLGLPSFNGQIEIASQDERILSQIPEDIKRVEGVPDAWVDSSPPNGNREFETTKIKKARAVFEFDKTKDEVDGHAKRIYVLESDSKHIVALLENLVKAAMLEAELHTSEISRAVEETAEKVAAQSAAIANGAKGSKGQDDCGVSYIG